MIIDFYDDTHTYVVNGQVASISVTELLHKHGLAPDYSRTPEERLKEKAAVGRAIHYDLEFIMNDKDYTAQSEYGKIYESWVRENLSAGVAEQVLAYEKDGVIFCGTADLLAFDKGGDEIIADAKTTSGVNREYVSWQTSVLDYFARKVNSKINGKPFFWTGAKKFFCFHFCKGSMKVVELNKVPDEEIEALLDAEIKGEKYQRKSLVVEEELRSQVEKAELALSAIEESRKEAEQRAKALREKLVSEMKRQGIKSWDTGKIMVTYIDPYERLSVDSSRLKREFPEVYKKCARVTKTGESVRITIRKPEEENVEL